MIIAINGEAHELNEGFESYISYRDVVRMAGYDPEILMTVKYSAPRHGDEQRSGLLSPDKHVRVEDGMRFTVTDTGGA